MPCETCFVALGALEVGGVKATPLEVDLVVLDPATLFAVAMRRRWRVNEEEVELAEGAVVVSLHLPCLRSEGARASSLSDSASQPQFAVVMAARCREITLTRRIRLRAEG